MTQPRVKPKPPTERQYEAAKIAQALSFAPTIRPCKECSWPVVNGYCCTYCGSTHP